MLSPPGLDVFNFEGIAQEMFVLGSQHFTVHSTTLIIFKPPKCHISRLHGACKSAILAR
jgi:hypothetical protein